MIKDKEYDDSNNNDNDDDSNNNDNVNDNNDKMTKYYLSYKY